LDTGTDWNIITFWVQLVHSLQAQDLPEEGEGSGSVSLKKVFQFLHQMVEALAMVPAAELSLRLYLQCAEVFLAIYHISSFSCPVQLSIEVSWKPAGDNPSEHNFAGCR
jgi:hypothetical protein